MWKWLALAFGLYAVTSSDAGTHPLDKPKPDKKDVPMTQEEFDRLQKEYEEELKKKGIDTGQEIDWQDDVFQGFDETGEPIWEPE